MHVRIILFFLHMHLILELYTKIGYNSFGRYGGICPACRYLRYLHELSSVGSTWKSWRLFNFLYQDYTTYLLIIAIHLSYFVVSILFGFPHAYIYSLLCSSQKLIGFSILNGCSFQFRLIKYPRLLNSPPIAYATRGTPPRFSSYGKG